MMRKALSNNRGETIVEILVSFLMLLIFISVFATAIRTANRMMTRANAERRQAYLLQEQLYPYSEGIKQADGSDSYTYSFKSENTGAGAFTVSGEYGSATTTATDTVTGEDVEHDFPEYIAGSTGGGAG